MVEGFTFGDTFEHENVLALTYFQAEPYFHMHLHPDPPRSEQATLQVPAIENRSTLATTP